MNARATSAGIFLLFTLLNAGAAFSENRPPPKVLLCPQRELQPLGKDYNTGKVILDKYGLVLAPIGFLASFNDWLNSDKLAALPKSSISLKVVDADGHPLPEAEIGVIFVDDERFLAQVAADGKPLKLPVGDYLFNVADKSGKMRWGAEFVSLKAGKPLNLTLKANHDLTLDMPAAFKGDLHAGSTLTLDAFKDQLQNPGIIILQGGQVISKPESNADGKFVLPSLPGKYAIQVAACAPTTGIVNWPITVVASNIQLKAVDSVAAFQSFDLAWSGDGSAGDMIGIRKAETGASVHGKYTPRDKDGKKLQMVAPPEAGDYELVYLSAFDGKELVSRKLHVTAAKPLVTAPTSLAAGQSAPFNWSSGPGNDAQITLWSGTGATAKQLDAVISHGNARIFAPQGSYELRLSDTEKSYWSQPLTLRPATALDGLPAQLEPGAKIAFSPDVVLRGFDQIGFFPSGTQDISKNRVSAANDHIDGQLAIFAPDVPGRYELIYSLSDEPGKDLILQRVPISVVGKGGAVGDIAAPDSVAPLEPAMLSWSNPENQRLEIWQSDPAKKPKLMRTLASVGNFNLGLPPGTYQLRLRLLTQQERDGDDPPKNPPVPPSSEFRKSLRITPARLVEGVPQTIGKGEAFTLKINGKPEFFDELVIVRAGEKNPIDNHLNSTTAGNSTIELSAPDHPGKYELVYVGSFDRNFSDMVLERQPFQVK